jgi:parallel beta-helix repeat protein
MHLSKPINTHRHIHPYCDGIEEIDIMWRKIVSIWVCIAMAFSSAAMLGVTQNSAFKLNPEASADEGLASRSLGGLLNLAGPTESATTHIISPAAFLQSHPEPLPSRVDNSAGLPPVGDQQSQGSCTAWAIGYYHSTFIENQENPIDLTNPENQTSPAFLYNVANGGFNGGSYMEDVADLLISNGACSMAEQPYDTADYISWPSEDWVWVSGMKRKAASQNWLNIAGSDGMKALKSHLADGNTATIGISVWRNFDYIENFNNTYCSSERYGSDRGGHIVTICGYDEAMPTADGIGAFKMVNSWGTGWGDAGYWWMTPEAMVDGYLGYGWVMYLESELNYTPKVQIDHPQRGDIVRNFGMGITISEEGIPLSSKPFLSCYWIEDWYGTNVQKHPFPAGKMAFDISIFLPYMNRTSPHLFTLSMSNSGSLAGALLTMEIHNAEWWEGDTSWETPLVLNAYTTTQANALVWPGQFLHLPLRVNSDIDFAHRAIGEFWKGNGTEANPFVIPGYYISGLGFGNCLYIGNTTAYFVIRDCYLEEATGFDWSDYHLGTGILINSASNGIIENNQVTVNFLGILLIGATDVLVTANDVSTNSFGIYVTASNGIVITENNLTQNTEYGLYLDFSGGSSIYHNNFIENTVQAGEYYASSAWTNGYPSGGNYWSDYNGIDRYSGPGQNQTLSDGIGDTPYTDLDTDMGEQDNYPLTVPWGFAPHVPKFSNDLVVGWNLVSFPLEMGSTSISEILFPLAGKCDAVKCFDSTDKNDPWKTYRIGSSVNDLANIDNTMGIWVHVTENCTLAVGGSVPASTNIVLYAGWNLIGYPSLVTGMNVGDAFWGTGADRVEVFDAGSSSLIKTVGPDYLMSPGEGYWVRVPADTVWTLNW